MIRSQFRGDLLAKFDKKRILEAVKACQRPLKPQDFRKELAEARQQLPILFTVMLGSA